MSEPATAPIPDRPLWYLGPRHIPVRGGNGRIPAQVTHLAREGDGRWTPIEDTAEGKADPAPQ
jgi:hypothetical protein